VILGLMWLKCRELADQTLGPSLQVHEARWHCTTVNEQELT
jgi:hypothetical protein